jgi:uncharacterized protein (DUF2062 family)
MAGGLLYKIILLVNLSLKSKGAFMKSTFMKSFWEELLKPTLTGTLACAIIFGTIFLLIHVFASLQGGSPLWLW